MWLGPPLIAAVVVLYAMAAPVLSEPGYTLTDAREVQEQCRRDGGTVAGEYHKGVVTDVECERRSRKGDSID